MQYNRRTLQELGLILYDSSNQVCICLIIIHYFQKAYMYLNDLYMCLHDNNLLLKPQKMQLMQNLAGTTSQVEVIVSNNSTKSLITTHKTIFLIIIGRSLGPSIVSYYAYMNAVRTDYWHRHIKFAIIS
jgi:hypothetical protein